MEIYQTSIKKIKPHVAACGLIVGRNLPLGNSTNAKTNAASVNNQARVGSARALLFDIGGFP